MNRRILRPLVACGAAAIICLAAGPRAAAVGNSPILERLAGVAVKINGAYTEREGPVDIVIERWSSAEERQGILASLDGGAQSPARLLDALQTVRRRVGIVLSPGLQTTGSRARLRRAHNIQFAQEINSPSGRRIVVAMDRHFGLGEPTRDFRSAGSELTLIEVRLGADGKGTGKVVPAAQVSFNASTLSFEVENYAAQPVRLTDVTSEKGVRALNSTL